MGQLIKGVLFEGRARVAAIDITDVVRTAIELHGLSPLATAALGRTMTAGAYLGANLKNSNDTFSLTVNCTGGLGRIVVAGDGSGHLRGFVHSPNFDLPLRQSDGKIDVGRGVGQQGEIVVVKDLGLKKPYIGRTNLVSGEIGEDFAYYLLQSEGIRSIVAVGVKVDRNGVVAAGGLIVEAMPDCTEDELFILEDIMSQMGDISTKLEKQGATALLDYYFGHLDSQFFQPINVVWQCNCSDARIDQVIKSIGAKEAMSIIEESGLIEVKCEFCSKIYDYDKNKTERLFDIKS